MLTFEKGSSKVTNVDLCKILLLQLIFLQHVLPALALVFPTRNAINSCSLVAASTSKIKLSNFCHFDSTAGGEGPDGRLYMRFGETDCVVTLKNCIPGKCYFVMEDAAPNIEENVVAPGQRTSFLQNVSADPSTATLVHTPRGFAFKPKTNSVTLYYSTATCGAFYKSRSRVGKQICGKGGIEAITNVLLEGLPFDTLCGYL